MRSRRARPWGLLLASFLAWAAWPAVAHASPSAKLTYVPRTGTTMCPDENGFRKAVASRPGYDPFFPAAPKTVVATVIAEMVLASVPYLADVLDASTEPRSVIAEMARGHGRSGRLLCPASREPRSVIAEMAAGQWMSGNGRRLASTEPRSVIAEMALDDAASAGLVLASTEPRSVIAEMLAQLTHEARVVRLQRSRDR